MVDNELIEDDDGALLPPELQRDSAIWLAVRESISDSLDVYDAEIKDADTERAMIALAPVLWPWLPSNNLNTQLRARSATKKSDLPVGAVIRICNRLAVRSSDCGDIGYDWRWVTAGAQVPYDDVYKASWDTT